MQCQATWAGQRPLKRCFPPPSQRSGRRPTLSKLALERAVALQAQALAPHVRVNGVAPGLIYVSGPQSDENFDRARSVNLLQSATDPADVARTAVFLAENPSITGVTIAVDKGQHLVPLAHDIMFVAEQLGPAAPQGTA